jgi:hypothetical protein
VPEAHRYWPDDLGSDRGEFFAHFSSQLIMRIGIEPAADAEPLRRDVAVPAVLICQDHLYDIAAEQAERLDQFRQR